MQEFLTLLQTDMIALTTTAGLLALLNIIIIDIVLSWDNAILIWMATRRLDPKNKKKAIFIWILLATLLRVIFSMGVTYLTKIPWVELFGALLLLYVVWKFYREIRMMEWHESHLEGWVTLSSAIKTIIIADVSMSLDNVLAVAWASHGNMVNLVIGLIFSIVLMAVASNYVATLLARYPSIQWVWLFVILFTALEMLEKWFFHVAWWFSMQDSIFNLLLIVLVVTFSILQTKSFQPNEKVFLEWVSKNGKILMVMFFVLLLIVVNVWDKIHEIFNAHHWYKYGMTIICVLWMLEVMRIREVEKKSLWERIKSKFF